MQKTFLNNCFFFYKTRPFVYVIQKLPKVENELKNLLQLYENKERTFFLYNDERLLDLIEKQSNEMKNDSKKLYQPKVFIVNFIQKSYN